MSRIALVVVLLWGMTGVGRAAPQDITIMTSPPGATITIVGSPDTVVGKTGEVVHLDLPSDPNQSVHLRLDLDDYKPWDHMVGGADLRRNHYPMDRPPIELVPAGTGMVVRLWAKAHWVVVAGLVLAALAALAAAGRWLWTLRQMHNTVVVAPNEAVVTDRVGQVVGGWRLVEHLGEGGTADVYRGMAANMPDAAVKIIRSGEVSPEMLARFRREAEILGALQHPAIVRLIDFGEDGDALYLVEELVGGGSLADRLQLPGLSVEAFYGYYRPVLEAMAFAHDQGIVHRDLKPENVLLTAEGEVKLSDFGLGKAATSSNVTTSNVMGTPTYMAPEQFSGAPGSPMTDQFALGVMAYEMLSGRLPFEGESVAELMARRLQDPPPLSQVRGAALPPPIEQTVMRMLSRRPEARFPNLHQVIAALDGARRGGPR